MLISAIKSSVSSFFNGFSYLFRDFSLFHSQTQTRIIYSRIVGKKSYFHKVNFHASRIKLNVAFSFSLVQFSLLEILSSFILLVAIRSSENADNNLFVGRRCSYKI